MAKRKPYLFNGSKPSYKLRVLCGTQRLFTAPNGKQYPVLNLTHEDVARLYEYSKLQKSYGNKKVSIEMYEKPKPRDGQKRAGRITYTLAIALPDKREIIPGSTFDKLIKPFDRDRDGEEDIPLKRNEIYNPTKGFKLRGNRKDANPDFDVIAEEVTPPKKKTKPTNLKKFDQLLADSIAEQKLEEEKNEIETNPEPVPEPEPKKPVEFDDDDSIYE